MTIYESFYTISRLVLVWLCTINILCNSLNTPQVVFLVPWELEIWPIYRFNIELRNKRLIKFKYNFISTNLNLTIKMDVDFEIFAARNGKKLQEMSSL